MVAFDMTSSENSDKWSWEKSRVSSERSSLTKSTVVRKTQTGDPKTRPAKPDKRVIELGVWWRKAWDLECQYRAWVIIGSTTHSFFLLKPEQTEIPHLWSHGHCEELSHGKAFTIKSIWKKIRVQNSEDTEKAKCHTISLISGI